MPPVHTSPDPALHEVVESIAALTELRDQQSLERSLFTAVQEMLEPFECWLLAIGRQPGQLHILAGNAASLPDEITGTADTLLGIKGMEVRHLGIHDYLFASTYSGDGGDVRLMAIASDRYDSSTLRLVQGMLKVYLNFMAILRDSEKDTLTGLYNRRKLEAKLNDLLAASLRGRRYRDANHSDFLAVLDLDHFKRVNDTFGHLIGDETLLSFANILRRTLRDHDLIFRYGGEEFVVLLQDVSGSQVAAIIERVLQNVRGYAFPQVGRVTVSVGYTQLSPGSTPPRVIEEADRALYYAKEHGRDQARAYHDLIDSGALRAQEEQGSIELF